jgi:hypothetical protein
MVSKYCGIESRIGHGVRRLETNLRSLELEFIEIISESGW